MYVGSWPTNHSDNVGHMISRPPTDNLPMYVLVHWFVIHLLLLHRDQLLRQAIVPHCAQVMYYEHTYMYCAHIRTYNTFTCT